ncbi:MAG: hypothetical protein JWO38_7866 [Gemmataceae bacterium]|nr:hypothetical protein [Gemmataceae bacterium]
MGHEFEWQRLLGFSLLLVALGGLLALEPWEVHWRNEVPETDPRRPAGRGMTGCPVAVPGSTLRPARRRWP